MKTIRIISIVIVLMTYGCSTKVTKFTVQDKHIDFSKFGIASCARGVSNTQIAAIFESIYNKYSEDSTFCDQLITYLNNDSCLFGYHYAFNFLHDQNGFTSISDNHLAEKVILNGLNRASQLITEDYAYAKCTFLWNLAIFYFQNDNHDEATKYCQLAYREESTECAELVPALEKEDMERFWAFYLKVRDTPERD